MTTFALSASSAERCTTARDVVANAQDFMHPLSLNVERELTLHAPPHVALPTTEGAR